MLAHNIVLWLVLYYGGLTVLGFGLWAVLPQALRVALGETLTPFLGATSFTDAIASPTAVAPVGRATALAELVAMSSAFALALPMSWVYMFTRQKKGYRQSVVHSLLLLPVVVAGVVVLVKYSLPLAFALAGIVAAVRFRNTLEDSKDAVYVFVSTALGLAAGVQLDIAIVLSVLFNLLVLSLWFTDFARTPPALEGERAKRQMEKALEIANRTSQFVAQVDREILRDMAPAQLDALGERLRKARDKSSTETAERPRLDMKLRVVATDPTAARQALSPTLTAQLKRWQLGATEQRDGEAVIEYSVKLRKSIPQEMVLAAIERDGAPYVVRAEIS